MPQEISTLRTYLLRAIYLLNFVGLSVMVWPAIVRHHGAWDPFYGVALSFWAALAALMGLGIRHPLKMLPLLLIQLLYKTIWLLAVGLPMWRAGTPLAMTKDMLIPAIIDVIVIPWPYVFANYFNLSRTASMPNAISSSLTSDTTTH